MTNLTTFAVPEHDLHPRPPDAPACGWSSLVPTRNEAANIDALLERIRVAVAGIPTEVVFVDDSDDDTPAAVRAAARRTGGGAFKVSLIHRQGSQRSGGLDGAVLEGLRTVAAPWACGMDADLQHPPELIPALLAAAEREHADLAIASRTAPTAAPMGWGRPYARVGRLHVGGQAAVPGPSARRHRPDERVLRGQDGRP